MACQFKRADDSCLLRYVINSPITFANPPLWLVSVFVSVSVAIPVQLRCGTAAAVVIAGVVGVLLLECFSHFLLCTFRSPTTKVPTARSQYCYHSSSKLSTEVVSPWFGGLYHTQRRSGPCAERTKCQERS